MHEQEQKNFVSLFHSLGNETVKQNPKTRNIERNKDETNTLNILALKILQRNNIRNKSETSPQNRVKQSPKKTASCFTTNKGDFCPLRFLNERDIGIDEVCPDRGLHLVAGYSLSQDLKHLITWWALGSFDKLLAAIHEHRPIKKRVIVSSLNRYTLPTA